MSIAAIAEFADHEAGAERRRAGADGGVLERLSSYVGKLAAASNIEAAELFVALDQRVLRPAQPRRSGFPQPSTS